MLLAIFSAPKRGTGSPASPACSAAYDIALRESSIHLLLAEGNICLCHNYDLILIAHLLGGRVEIAYVAVILY